MKVFKLLMIVLALSSSLSVIAQQSTYVIVHGAWGGAWQFKKTAFQLQEAGHHVYRPSLTGLGDKHHLAHKDINLSTHINDVVNAIIFEDLKDVILVGHSYGGMVITGVADSIPHRIKKLIYLDAIVPHDGESAFQALSHGKEVSISSITTADEHFLIPAWVRDTTKTPRDVPHPIKTMTQSLLLKNNERLVLPTTYVFTAEESKGGAEKDDFYPFYLRAKSNNWKIIHLEASHNPQIDKLDKLIDILLQEK